MNSSELSKKLIEFNDGLVLSEKSNNTIKYYNRAICLFIEYISDKELNKKEVISFKNQLLESSAYKKTTIDRYIVAVNKFLDFCGLKELKVKQLKMQTRMSYDKSINETDYKRLLRWSKKLGMDNIYMIMKVLANTGIRVSELRYFKVDNINNIIEVKNKGKIRNIVIRQELLRDLRKYCKENKIKEGYIFTNKTTKKPINNGIVWQKLKEIASKAKVNRSKVYAHSFRHFFAKRFLDDGNNVLELADILGHSSLDTTRIYNRSSDLEKQRKIERIVYNK